MSKAYLGVGTNIGNCIDNLKNVIVSLNLLPMTRVTQVSKIYKTAPVGFSEQDDFYNMVVEVETKLTAENLLGACLGIEAGFGRIRTIKNGPRIIDIDLLLYDEQVYNTKTLILPHPRMFEREFVLRPLLDLDFTNSFVDREKIIDSLTGEGIELVLENI